MLYAKVILNTITGKLLTFLSPLPFKEGVIGVSKDRIINMLKTVSEFHNVEIKLTSSIDNRAKLLLKSLEDSPIIQITNLELNTILYLDDLDKAAKTIQTILKEDSPTLTS